MSRRPIVQVADDVDNHVGRFQRVIEKTTTANTGAYRAVAQLAFRAGQTYRPAYDAAEATVTSGHAMTVALDGLAVDIANLVDAESAELRALIARSSTNDNTSTTPALPVARLVTIEDPPLPEGIVYVRSDLRYPSKPGIETPVQVIGDCFFVASLRGVIGKAPRFLDNCVHAEGEMVVVSVGGGSYSLAQTLPVTADGKAAGAWSPVGNRASYAEKAFAAMKGGYDRLDQGGEPKEALSWLTGKPAESAWLAVAPGQVGKIIGTKRLHRLLSSDDQIVVASSRTASAEGYGSGFTSWLNERFSEYQIVENHSYTVIGPDETGAIIVRDQPDQVSRPPIPRSMFVRLFCRVSWCEVP